MLWELVFMLVILKIPVAYLCAVVWWAIKAEPLPPQTATQLTPVPPRPLDCGWRSRSRAFGRGPLPRLGGPSSRRPPRVAYARAKAGASA